MHISSSLDIGGIETLILELCKTINRDKYFPMVCSFSANGKLQDEFSRADIPVYILKKKEGNDWVLPFKLSKLLRKLKIDVVHTHDQSPWLYGAIASKLSNRSLVHTEHTTIDYDSTHLQKWNKIEWFLSKITNQIITVSNSVAKYMTEKVDVPSSKIHVIYNGVKAEIHNNKVDDKFKKHELGIDDTDLIVGSVARLYPNKDQKTLLQAFKIVIQRVPKVKLLIAGDGPLKNELLQTAEGFKLNGKVKFLGNRRDVPELLQLFDLFVLPSLREGFPIVLLEAMASGLPTVTTDVDGNAELVLDGETGLIVPPNNPEALGNAIIRLLVNKNERKRMGQKGRQRINAHFSFENMVTEYEKAYNSVLKH